MIPTKVPRLNIVLPQAADGSTFAAYRAASASHVAIGLPEGTTAADFFIDGATWQLPHATLTRVRSCAQTMKRGTAELAHDPAPTIALYLQIEGEAQRTCEGRVAHLRPGDVVIYDSRRSYEASATAFDVLILQMARERVPLAFLAPAVHGLPLPREQAGTRLLAAAWAALMHEIEELSVGEADHAASALFQLAAGVVDAELARCDADRPRFAEPQLADAMAFIERKLADVELSTDEVRRYLGLSRSSLYRMFQQLGGVDATIRQRRLDAAMRVMLSDAAPLPASDELARRFGFGNATHFVRAFQGRFGATPVQFRRKLATGDATWLTAQARRAGFVSHAAWLAALNGDG